MPQSLKKIKLRIRGVGSIKKITRAMEMVSFAKLSGIYKDIYNAREYLAKLEDILYHAISAGSDLPDNIYISERPEKKKILLCVFSSDTGLCGNYNNSIIHAVEEYADKSEGKEIGLLIIGKKAFSHFKNSYLNIEDSYTDCYGRFSLPVCNEISEKIMHLFISGKADEVYAAYSHFESASRYKIVVKKVLNIERRPEKQQDYLFEPDVNAALDRIAPLYIKSKIKAIMLSSFASEHAVRVMAMGEATENAEDLIDTLTLQRNRMRQANITTEITEVVSASEALR